MSNKAQRVNVKIMGILNVTPDSFSDGGRFFSVQKAIAQALRMAKEGADIIDVGGESSGPGSLFVPQAKELRRVIPVIKKLAALFDKTRPRPVISIDTYKAETARQAVAAGAGMINDVTALRGDPQMAKTVARLEVPVVLMYSKDSSARTTRAKKRYKNVVKTVFDFLKERVEFAQKAGIKKQNIIIDPGMGAFISAEPKYSYEILRRLREFKKLGCPVLIGVSRKSFLPGAVGERLIPTLLANFAAVQNGADIIRAHDVKEHKKLLDMLFPPRRQIHDAAAVPADKYYPAHC